MSKRKQQVELGRRLVNLTHEVKRFFEAFEASEDRPIGEDGLASTEIAEPLIGALRAVLNFEVGNLDCGSWDATILEIARKHGVSVE